MGFKSKLLPVGFTYFKFTFFLSIWMNECFFIKKSQCLLFVKPNSIEKCLYSYVEHLRSNWCSNLVGVYEFQVVIVTSSIDKKKKKKSKILFFLQKKKSTIFSFSSNLIAKNSSHNVRSMTSSTYCMQSPS